jgi:hypothetical protein
VLSREPGQSVVVSNAEEQSGASVQECREQVFLALLRNVHIADANSSLGSEPLFNHRDKNILWLLKEFVLRTTWYSLTSYQVFRI